MGVSVGAVVPDPVVGGSVVAGSVGFALPDGSVVVVGAGVSSAPEAEVDDSTSSAAEVDDSTSSAAEVDDSTSSAADVDEGTVAPSPEGDGDALNPQASAAFPTLLP